MHGSQLYGREDWEEAIRLGTTGAVARSAPLVERTLHFGSLAEGHAVASAADP